jgi:hypothetical protein
MELTPHLEALRSDLAAAAAVGGDDVARAARLLGDAVEPALRLVLLDLLQEAAEELTTQLGGATVELRLRGRDVELVAAAPPPAPAPPNPPAGATDAEDGTARLTLRLPEGLKARAEAAAAGDGVSVNTWLVRAVTSAVTAAVTAAASPDPSAAFPFSDLPPGPRRITGFGRA